MSFVLFHSVAVYEYVIYVYQHTLVKEFEEELIHNTLEGCRGVTEAKWHHRELKLAIACYKCSLFSIRSVHGDLVITIT